jgi:hypothetical protein
MQAIPAFMGVMYPRQVAMGYRQRNQQGQRDHEASNERHDRSIDEDDGSTAHDECEGVADPGIACERQADRQKGDGPRTD